MRVTDRDPLELMRFMSTALSFRFIAPLNGSHWSDVLGDINEWCEETLEGNHRLLLGNETLLTDTHAEYVLYCDSRDDLTLAAMNLI